LGREGLILLSPATPYVCVGYFQNVEEEVDVDFCGHRGIPIFRRETGGGAVYLDGEQLFYQLIVHRDSPLVPDGREAFYRTFLQPPIEAYRALGVAAEFRPVNDIVVAGRKISGNGVADIGDYVVMVGNLIVDFDFETMARVLRVPDEKFRDRLYRTLHENLSTLRQQVGAAVPGRDELWDLLASEFERVLGPLDVVVEVDDEWRSMADRLADRFLTEEWLFRKRRRSVGGEVRIRSGLDVRHGIHKAPGGLIRASAEVRAGKLAAVSLSGDFFFFPEHELTDLEKALDGVEDSDVEEVVSAFYQRHGIESPGVAPADFALALGGRRPVR
jgi:lipoate-protein ligase A